jgi:thiol-disulfide isomerase/thioredoxin
MSLQKSSISSLCKLDYKQFKTQLNFMKSISKFLIFSFFPLIFFPCRGIDLQIKNSKTVYEISPNIDSIYLINKTKRKFGFFYNDKYLNLTQVHLWPDSSCKIFSDSRLLLTQTNENQNFYLLYPGDTLYVSVNNSGDAILSLKDDSIRNNELKLQPEMNNSTPINFWKMNSYRGKYFNIDYKKMDSFYLVDYKAKTAFIEDYKKTYTISKSYEKLIITYIKSQLYANELWMGATSKANFDKSYLNYLMALKSPIANLIIESENPIYNYLQYGYLRFTLKNLSKSNTYLDSLYSRCKTEVNEKDKELVLLKIVKEEIQNNKNSNKWFIKDFITTCKNNEYKSFVMNMIENNELALTAGSNNILINEDNKKLEFDSLIKKFKNKVIYIDIWASWCAPCRAEMPKSAVLRNKYKDIIFIYLSIDDNISDWKKANSDENLTQYGNSYLLLNPQKADILKELKVYSIPRYLVINKKGEIINSNVPSPGNQAISAFLINLLE